MHVRLELGGTTFDVEMQQSDDGWDVTVDDDTFRLELDHNSKGVVVASDAAGEAGTFHVDFEGDRHVNVDGKTLPLRILALGDEAAAGAAGAADGIVRAPMNGKLESVEVATGDSVEEGTVLFVLEAMKMRNQVKAPRAGVVASIDGTVGAALSSGDPVVTLETE